MLNKNHFTRDFIHFLELRHPDWFPQRCLNNIPVPKSENLLHDDPNKYYLQYRLNQVLSQVYGADAINKIGGRYAINVDYKWASEVHLAYKSSNDNDIENSLIVTLYPADTKYQA